MPKRLLRRKPRRGNKFTVVLCSILIASVLTFIAASILLYFKTNATLVIYSMIVIWLGIAVMSYLAQTDR